MSDKLSEEELLEKLGIWYITWTKEYSNLIESIALVQEEESKQAYQQIVALMQEDNMKRNMIIENRVGIKKPEITEEWIQMKAKSLINKLLDINPTMIQMGRNEWVVKAEDFIRSLVEEIV